MLCGMHVTGQIPSRDVQSRAKGLAGPDVKYRNDVKWRQQEQMN